MAGGKKKANNFENSIKKLNFSQFWLNTSENDSGYNDLPTPGLNSIQVMYRDA